MIALSLCSLPTCEMGLESYLLREDGQGPLQGVGGAVLGGTGQALGVVTHLGLQRGDLTNQILRSQHILWLVVGRLGTEASGT